MTNDYLLLIVQIVGLNALYTVCTVKCTTCLNGILWSKDTSKERNLNIYNALIESSLLYGSET
jgi:hypothetical protein